MVVLTSSLLSELAFISFFIHDGGPILKTDFLHNGAFFRRVMGPFCIFCPPLLSQLLLQRFWMETDDSSCRSRISGNIDTW